MVVSLPTEAERVRDDDDDEDVFRGSGSALPLL